MRAIPVVLWAAAVAASPAMGELLVNGDFEMAVGTTGPLPDGCGYWRGNNSTITESSSGIAPLDGARMIRFLNSFTGPDGDWGAVECNVYQLVDLGPFRGLIQTGTAVVTLSAAFNRVSGDGQTDTVFYAGALSYAGSPSDFPAQVSSYTAGNGTTILTDAESTTWELASTTLLLPADTTYLAVSLVARENIFNDTSGVEFDGHYADSVSLTIIPEPTALSLMLGGLAILRRR